MLDDVLVEVLPDDRVRVLVGIFYFPPPYGLATAEGVLVDTEGFEVRGDYMGALLVPGEAP